MDSYFPMYLKILKKSFYPIYYKTESGFFEGFFFPDKNRKKIFFVEKIEKKIKIKIQKVPKDNFICIR